MNVINSVMNDLEGSVYRVWSALTQDHNTLVAEEQLKDIKKRLPLVLSHMTDFTPDVTRGRESRLKIWLILCGPLYRYPGKDDEDAGTAQSRREEFHPNRKRLKMEQDDMQMEEGEEVAEEPLNTSGAPHGGRVDVSLLRSLERIRDGAFSVMLPSHSGGDGGDMEVSPPSSATLGKMLTTCLSIFVQSLDSPLRSSISSSQQRELWELGWGILSLSDALNQLRASQAESLALMRASLLATVSDDGSSNLGGGSDARTGWTPSQWSLSPALVHKTALCCLTLSQKKSSSSRVKSIALQVLGLLCERHTEVMRQPCSDYGTHPEGREAVAECFLKVMSGLCSARAADQLLAEGYLKGLSSYLNGFPLENQVPAKLRALLGQFLLAGLSLADTRENHNYQLPKAVLHFLSQHAESPVLAPVLYQHAERLVELLERMWQHKNQAVRRLSVGAVTVVTQALALQFTSTPEASASGLTSSSSYSTLVVKRLVDKVIRPRLASASSVSSDEAGAVLYSRRALSFALVLSGHLARAIRCCMGRDEVDFLLRGLVAYVENWLSSPNTADTDFSTSHPTEETDSIPPPVASRMADSTSSTSFLSDIIYFLAPFTSSLACFLLEIEDDCPVVFQTAKQLVDVMLQLLPEEAYFESLRQASSVAIRRLLVALQTCRHRLPSSSFLLPYAAQRTVELASCGESANPTVPGRGALLGIEGVEVDGDDEAEEWDSGEEVEEVEGGGPAGAREPGLAVEDEQRRFERLERYAMFWKRVLEPEDAGAEELGYPFEKHGEEELGRILREEFLRSSTEFLCGLDLSICLPCGTDGSPNTRRRQAGLSDVLQPSCEVQPTAPADYEQFLRFVEFYYILAPSLWRFCDNHAKNSLSEENGDSDVWLVEETTVLKVEDNHNSNNNEEEEQVHVRELITSDRPPSQDWELLYQFLERLSQWILRYPHVSGLLTLFYRTLLAAADLPVGRASSNEVLEWDTEAVRLPTIPLVISEQLGQVLLRCRRVCEKRMYIFADDLLYQCSMCVLVSGWWYSVLLPSLHPPHAGGELHRDDERVHAATSFSAALDVVLKGFHSVATDVQLSARLLEWRHENTRCAEWLTEAYVRYHPAQVADILLPLLRAEWFYRFPRLTYLAACHGLSLANADSDYSLYGQYAVGQQEDNDSPGKVAGAGTARQELLCSSLSALETRGHPIVLPLADGRSLRFPCGRLIRRVAHLCLHASEPAARSTACELFHAMVTWMVGESGSDGTLSHWYEETLDTVVMVAALSDNAVTRELFSDLLLQCVRWFAYQGASTGLREAEDGLQRLLFAKLWDERAAVRQVSVSAFMERLQYINRSRDTSSLRAIDAWESGVASLFSGLRSQLLQSTSESRDQVEGSTSVIHGSKARISRAVAQLSCLSLLEQVLEHSERRELSNDDRRAEAVDWLVTLVTFLERIHAAGELDENNGMLELLSKCLSRAAGLLQRAGSTSSRLSDSSAASAKTAEYPPPTTLWQLCGRLLSCFQWVSGTGSGSGSSGLEYHYLHHDATLGALKMTPTSSGSLEWLNSTQPMWLVGLLKALRAVESETLRLFAEKVPLQAIVSDPSSSDFGIGESTLMTNIEKARELLQRQRQDMVRQLLWHNWEEEEEKEVGTRARIALLRVLPSRLFFFQCVSSYDLSILPSSSSGGESSEEDSLFLPLLENLWAQLEAVLESVVVGGRWGGDRWSNKGSSTAPGAEEGRKDNEEDGDVRPRTGSRTRVCGRPHPPACDSLPATSSLELSGAGADGVVRLLRSMEVFLQYLLHLVKVGETTDGRCRARATDVCCSLRVFPVKPWVQCLGGLMFSFPFLSVSLAEQSPLGSSLWCGTSDLMECVTVRSSPEDETTALERLEFYEKEVINAIVDSVPPRFLAAFSCLSKEGGHPHPYQDDNDEKGTFIFFQKSRGGTDFKWRLALRSAMTLSSRPLWTVTDAGGEASPPSSLHHLGRSSVGVNNVWHAVLRSAGEAAVLDERSLLSVLRECFPPPGQAPDVGVQDSGWLEGVVLLLLRAGVRLSDILQNCVYRPRSVSLGPDRMNSVFRAVNTEEEESDGEAVPSGATDGPQKTMQTQEATVLRLVVAAVTVFITQMHLRSPPPFCCGLTSFPQYHDQDHCASPSGPPLSSRLYGLLLLEELLEDLCALVQYPMMIRIGSQTSSTSPRAAAGLTPPPPLVSLDAAVSLAEHVMTLLLREDIAPPRLGTDGDGGSHGWVLHRPLHRFLDSVLTTALPSLDSSHSGVKEKAIREQREAVIAAKLRLVGALFSAPDSTDQRIRSGDGARAMYELQASLAPALAGVFREGCDWQRGQLLLSTSAVALLTQTVYLYARVVGDVDAQGGQEHSKVGESDVTDASSLISRTTNVSVLLDAGEEISKTIVQYELPLHWREVLDLTVTSGRSSTARDRHGGYENYRQVLRALTLICGAVWKFRPSAVRQLLPLWAQSDYPHLDELCRFWSALIAEQCEAAAEREEADGGRTETSVMDCALLALCHLGCEWQKQTGMPTAMWWAVSHQVLFPAIRVLRPKARLEFFRVRLSEIMSIASFAPVASTCSIPSKMALLLSEGDLRQATNAMGLLEIMCVHCSPDDLRGTLNQSVLTSSEQPGTGKELIKKLIDLSRKAVELEAPTPSPMSESTSAPNTSCWLSFHQAAHRCLIAIVTTTQTQEMLFARVLFPAKGPKWWHHIVNLELTHEPSENASSHGLWVSEEESKGEGYAFTRRAVTGKRRIRAATQFLLHDGETMRGSLPSSQTSSHTAGPPSELTLTRMRSSAFLPPGQDLSLRRQQSVTSSPYHRSASELEIEGIGGVSSTQALFAAPSLPLQRPPERGSTSMLLQDKVWKSTNTGELLRVVDLLISRTPPAQSSGHEGAVNTLPEWIKGMISLLTTTGIHLNVKLVILRLFCLRSSFFRPYARQTTLCEAMLAVAMSSHLGTDRSQSSVPVGQEGGDIGTGMGRLHYIARETIAVVLQWSQEDGCYLSAMTVMPVAVLVLSETITHFSSYASPIVPEEGWKALRNNLGLFRAVCEASDSIAMQGVCQRSIFPKLLLPALRDTVGWRAGVQICGVLLQSTPRVAAGAPSAPRSLARLGGGEGREDCTFSESAEWKLVVEAMYEELVRLLENKGGASAEIIGLELKHLRADFGVSALYSTLLAQSSQRLIGLYAVRPTVAIRAIRAVVEHEPSFLREVVGAVLPTFSALDGDCQSLFLECLTAYPELAEASYDWVHAQFAAAWYRDEEWIRPLRQPLIQLLTVMAPQVTRNEDQKKMISTFLSAGTMRALRRQDSISTLWAAYQFGLRVATSPEWSTWNSLLSSFLLRSARQESNVTIQDAVLKFADTSVAPQDFSARLMFMLRDDTREGESDTSIVEHSEGWLRHTALLLLSLSRRATSFSSRDFYFRKPLVDGAIFVEKDVQSLWTTTCRAAGGYRTQNTPLFYGHGVSQNASMKPSGRSTATIAFAPSSQLYGNGSSDGSGKGEGGRPVLPVSRASRAETTQNAVFFTIPPPSFFYGTATGGTRRRSAYGVAGLVVPTGKTLVQRQQQTQRQVTGRMPTLASSATTFISPSTSRVRGNTRQRAVGGETLTHSDVGDKAMSVSDATHSMIRAAAAKRRREADKSALQQWRAGLTPVTLYRRYQEGDFPDIQLPPEAFITPLQALCLYDAGVAALVCSSVIEEVVEQEKAVAFHTVTRQQRQEGVKENSAGSNSATTVHTSDESSSYIKQNTIHDTSKAGFPHLAAELTDSISTFLSYRLLFPMQCSPHYREGHALLLRRSEPTIFFMLEMWYFFLSGSVHLTGDTTLLKPDAVNATRHPPDDDVLRALQYQMSLLENPVISVSEQTRRRWLGSAAEAVEWWIHLRHAQTSCSTAQQLCRTLQSSGEAALGLEAAVRWMPRKAARVLRQGWQWEQRGAYSDALRLYKAWLSENPVRTHSETHSDKDGVDNESVSVEEQRMYLAHELVQQQRRDAAHKLMQWDDLADSFEHLNALDGVDPSSMTIKNSSNPFSSDLQLPAAHLQWAAAILRQHPSLWLTKKSFLLASDALHRSSISSFETFAALLALAPPSETITKVSDALPRLLSGGGTAEQGQVMERFRLAFRLTVVLDAARVLQEYDEVRHRDDRSDDTEEGQERSAGGYGLALSALRRFVRNGPHYGWDNVCQGAHRTRPGHSLTNTTKTYRDGWLLDDLLLVHDILFTRLENEGGSVELKRLRDASLADRLQACIATVSVLLDKPEGNGCAKRILRYATTRCNGSRETLESLALRTRFFDLSFSACARGGVEEALKRLKALRGDLSRARTDGVQLTCDLYRAEVMLQVEAGSTPVGAGQTSAADVSANSSSPTPSLSVTEGLLYGKSFYDALCKDVESSDSILGAFDAMLSHLSTYATELEDGKSTASTADRVTDIMDDIWLLYVQSLLCRLRQGPEGSPLLTAAAGGGGRGIGHTARYIPRLWQALRRSRSQTDPQWLSVLEQLFHGPVSLAVWVPWTCQIVYTYIATRHLGLLSLLIRLVQYSPEVCFYPLYAEQDSLMEILEETLSEASPLSADEERHREEIDRKPPLVHPAPHPSSLVLLRELLALLGRELPFPPHPHEANENGISSYQERSTATLEAQGRLPYGAAEEIRNHVQFGTLLYHLHPPDFRLGEWESRVEVALLRFWKSLLPRDRAVVEGLFELWRRDTMDASAWRRSEKVNHDFAAEAEKHLLPLLAVRVPQQDEGPPRWSFRFLTVSTPSNAAAAATASAAASTQWREYRQKSDHFRVKWRNSPAMMQTKGSADLGEFSLSLQQLLAGQGASSHSPLLASTLPRTRPPYLPGSDFVQEIESQYPPPTGLEQPPHCGSTALALPVHPLSVLGRGRRMCFSGELPEQVERVTGVSRSVRVLASKQQPKVVRLSTSTRATFRMLVKGGDDLRQDQRVQDLFHMFNLLVASTESGQGTPAMLVRTYGVVPISRWVGLVEFVPHTTTLGELILGSLHRELTQREEIERLQRWERGGAGEGVLSAAAPPPQPARLLARSEGLAALPAYQEYFKKLPDPNTYLQSMLSFRDAENKRIPAKDLSKWFQDLTKSITPTYLTEGLQRIAPFISEWHGVKRRFLHSHSTLALLCYLFGIGDRHLSNHLVDVQDGTLIGIDFGFAFDSAVRSLVVPELVPIRHTAQIRAVQGVLGDAVTHSYMSSALQRIREHRSVFDAVAAAFVDAPIGNEPQLLRTLGAVGEIGRKRRSEWGRYKLRLLHWKLHDLHDPADVLFHSVSQRDDCKKSPDLLAGLKSLIYDTSGRRRASGARSLLNDEEEERRNENEMGDVDWKAGGGGEQQSLSRQATTAGRKETLDVSMYTHRLLAISTDPNLLARMWIGWSSFL